jgi:hypothetical protein
VPSVNIDSFNPAGAVPIKINDVQYSMSNYKLGDVNVNGEPHSSGSISVPKGVVVSVRGIATIELNDWSKFNTVVLCPSIITTSASDGRWLYMCPGILDYRMDVAELPSVLAMLPNGLRYEQVIHSSIKIGSWRGEIGDSH